MMNATKLKVALFAMALVPSLMQAQPAVADSVGGKPVVPIADLAYLVLALATTIVLFKSRKKKLAA
jgi:hypothetical protein